MTDELKLLTFLSMSFSSSFVGGSGSSFTGSNLVVGDDGVVVVVGTFSSTSLLKAIGSLVSKEGDDEEKWGERFSSAFRREEGFSTSTSTSGALEVRRGGRGGGDKEEEESLGEVEVDSKVEDVAEILAEVDETWEEVEEEMEEEVEEALLAFFFGDLLVRVFAGEDLAGGERGEWMVGVGLWRGSRWEESGNGEGRIVEWVGAWGEMGLRAPKEGRWGDGKDEWDEGLPEWGGRRELMEWLEREVMIGGVGLGRKDMMLCGVGWVGAIERKGFVPHSGSEEQWPEEVVVIFLIPPPFVEFLLETIGWKAETIFGDLVSSKLLWLCLVGEILLLLLLLRLVLLLLLMFVMVTPEDLRGHSVQRTRNFVTASLGTNE